MNERRVHRQVSVPVSAFDVWKALQRAWKLDTGAEVLTRLLYEAAPRVGLPAPVMKPGAPDAQTPARGRNRPATGPSGGALPEPLPVAIASLVRDARLQVRDGVDPGTVRTYENVLAAGEPLPAVRVVDVGGVRYVVDGWHRIAAAEGREQDTVPAIVTAGTLDEARWLAASLNLTHGLPLTRAEKRRAFSVYVATRRHRDGTRYKSYREMAAELPGVARHTSLRNWMRKDHPKIAAAMAKVHPDDEPRTNDGASWPAPDPLEFACKGARHAVAQAVATVAALPEDAGRALWVDLCRMLDGVAGFRVGWMKENENADGAFDF